MLRQASSRNQRAKGLKAKHVVQVLVLVAVCVWLLYQVKHSLDKKKELEDGNTEISTMSEYRSLETLRLGRKDLVRNGVRTNADYEMQDEGKDEAEEEPEILKEFDEGDSRGIWGDEIDEHDNENADEEAGNIEELGDEEGEGKLEELESLKNYDHGNAEANLHGMWEEHLDGDDASNAIRNPKNTESETERALDTYLDEEQMGDMQTNLDREIRNRTNDSEVSHDMDEYALQEGEIRLFDDTSIDMSSLGRDVKPEAKSYSNSTADEFKEQKERESNITIESSSDPEVEMLDNSSQDNSSSVVDAEIRGLPSQDATPGMDLNVDQNVTSVVEKMVEDNTDIVVEETWKTGATKEEEVEENSMTSTITDGGNTIFDETDNSFAKDHAITDEEEHNQTDLFTLLEGQSDTKKINDIATN